MIDSKIVLVLGAGASHSYGFPTGRELIHLICQRLSVELGDHRPILQRYSFQDDEIHRFQFGLLHSNLPSVDIFLENNPQYMKIGKVAIALALIPFENPERPVRKDELKWYEYLFNQMGASPDEFEASKSRLPILTFNYDRSLEYFLLDSLTHAYGGSEVNATRSLKHLRVIHMYGELGKPSYLSSEGRAFTPDLTYEAVD